MGPRSAINTIQKTRLSSILGVVLMSVVSVAHAINGEGSPPAFSKSFSPAIIGPGSVATLRFDIDNTSEVPTDVVNMLAFTDALPAGVTIATPANASTDCSPSGTIGPTLSAPAGGTTISLSDASVAASATCAVTVDVTSSTVGTHTNISGDLTSDTGNSGTATDDLVVTGSLPGFTKSFSPSSISLGDRSTLTFTIDNTANDSAEELLDFTDVLPSGMVIANPANAATDCGTAPVVPTLIAAPGTNLIDFSVFGTVSFPGVAAGASCTVTVDVTTTAGGDLDNLSSELLLEDNVSAGKASATLVSTVTELGLRKSFIEDPVPPSGTVALQFTIDNRNRDFPATGISFTDDLDATLSGLATVGLPASDVCGAGSTLTGTGVLTLTGGSLPAGGSCSFGVPLAVPAAAPVGAYENTTSVITGTVDGASVVGNKAKDSLFVSTAPLLTKEFIDDPVGAGGTGTLRFTITNTNPDSSLTDIEFTDDLNTAIMGLAANSLVSGGDPDPLVDPCGTGSELTVNDPLPTFIDPDPTMLIFTGGSLAPAGSKGDSCTFDVTLDVPDGVPTGTYANTTSELTGTVFGEVEANGLLASGDLLVVGAPRLLKEFTDDPVQPGDTVTLEFTLSHDPNAAGNATGIAFTDDIGAALSGLVATGLPLDDVCGTGSLLSGTSVLSLSGGTLAPGASCTFSVALQVPTAAPYGSHTNTTSKITATLQGVTVTGNAAADDLKIPALVLTKSFTDDPVIPGNTATLRFTLDNMHLTDTATGIAFTDDLGAALAGLTATLPPTPDPPCGVGSSLTGLAGDTILTFAGGTLSAGTSCFFDVTVMVPAGTADGTYVNTTSGVSSSLGSGDPATDDLTVNAELLFLTKSFSDDPVAPNGTVTLEFTLTLDATAPGDATGIAFSDNIGAALTGLTATLPPTPDPPCGVGSSLTGLAGDTILTFAGGTLSPGEECTFRLTLQVPADAPTGNYVNTTSDVSATVQTLPVGGTPASDTLSIGIDTDGDGIVDEVDDDDDNDGLRDQFEMDNNYDPLDPDTDDDGIIDGLDRLPGAPSNSCFGLGDDVVLANVIIGSGTELTCAAPGSISIESTVVIQNNGGLELITRNADFRPDFDVPEGARLSVISTDPSAPLP